MTDTYLAEFDRWAVGPPARKQEWIAELRSHLQEAQARGDLDDALSRLGTPRQAAARFAEVLELTPAPLSRRVAAGLVDYLPLVVAGLYLFAESLRDATTGVSLAIPAGVVIDSTRSLAANLVPTVAVLWAVAGLAVIETRYGVTPGKAITGLRTVADNRTATSIGQSVLRRVPFLLGPVLVVDAVVAVLSPPRHRRLFELVASTNVVVDPARTASQPGTVPA